MVTEVKISIDGGLKEMVFYKPKSTMGYHLKCNSIENIDLTEMATELRTILSNIEKLAK